MMKLVTGRMCLLNNQTLLEVIVAITFAFMLSYLPSSTEAYLSSSQFLSTANEEGEKVKPYYSTDGLIHESL